MKGNDAITGPGPAPHAGIVSLPELVIIAITLLALYLISTENFLLYHGIAELAGIAVAFSIFVIIWNTRRVVPDGFFLIVGFSFLFFGSIDLVHTLAYKGVGVFAGDNANLPTQLWIAARYFQGIAFLAATFFIGRTITRDRRFDTAIVMGAFTVVTGVLLASILSWQNFPDCFIEGSGLTLFKIASEYVISLILIVSILILYRKREHFDPLVWRFLIVAQVFLILGELVFTSYISVYGFMNMLGHLFRLLSIYFFYRAFVVIGLTRPYDLLLRELKQNEESLRSSEEKYRKLFENMLEGFAYCRIIYDENGQPADWEYIDVNRAFGQLTGLTDITGKRVLEAIPDIRELAPELFETYGRVASTGKPESFEIDFKPLKMWLHVSVFSPEKGYFVAVFENISERKRKENVFAEINRKLQLLASITRHDVRNQLFTLKAYLDLSKQHLGDSGKIAEYILKEERAVDAIERQIAFTKEYQDLGVTASVWQSVGTCVRDAAAVLPMRDIHIDLPPGNAEVYADPLFAKVFYNLIDNALRYGGEKMTKIRISWQESGTALAIVVQDDGTGIPAADKRRLFTKGFGHHTGLGLFLSREFLSITGITITENGDPGSGARFEMVVPEGAWRIRPSQDTPAP